MMSGSAKAVMVCGTDEEGGGGGGGGGGGRGGEEGGGVGGGKEVVGEVGKGLRRGRRRVRGEVDVLVHLFQINRLCTSHARFLHDTKADTVIGAGAQRLKMCYRGMAVY